MNEKIKEQILSIRDMGVTNMFDCWEVQRIANKLGYCELVMFIQDHRNEYCKFIMIGE